MKKTSLFLILILFIMIIFVTPSWAKATHQLIVINKGTNQLAFYQNNELVRVFPVATGKSPSLTPEGNFYITNKIINPPYYKLNIPGGSPHNPLGTRWLGISAPGGPYGIHGNNNPASIGTYASLGCVRLHNDDILWLYERVAIGTPVKIVNHQQNLIEDTPPEKVIITINENLAPEHCHAIKVKDEVLVALRPLVEYLGFYVQWDKKTNSIIVKGIDLQVTVQVNNPVLLIDDTEYSLASTPRIIGDTTYVSPDFFSNAMGYQVRWDPDSKKLNIIANDLYLPIQ
ncbi:L,D-transpeptidase family protein [Desulfofalx alkaliphila]|uniref:L,D-transpeptidase family protein n=1 Tax=Desulfofalx alkaliphila TaxID=105483 RepID=UPI00068D50F3|nr:L,D-transpeptidase family protein [Desulfofalx alkaliphila]